MVHEVETKEKEKLPEIKKKLTTTYTCTYSEVDFILV